MEPIGMAWWIVIAILGLLGIGALMRHKGEKSFGMGRNVWLLVGVGGATFLFLMQGGFLSQFGLGPVGGIIPAVGLTVTEDTTSTDNLGADILGCDLGTKVTVTLSGADKYSSAASGGTHRYRINGAPALTVSDAGTLTASPGDKLSILWSNATTTNTNYFSFPEEVTVPCTGAKTFSTLLVKNGTITSSEKDSEDLDIDGLAANQTLAAGDVKDVTVKLAGAFQSDFPNGFVAVAEYNKTEIDGIKFILNGVELSSANKPQSWTGYYGATETATKSVELPALISNADLSFKVQIDADDTYNPASTGNVTIKYFAKNYFINEDKGGMFDGPSAEDEDNVVTRTGQYVTNIPYD